MSTHAAIIRQTENGRFEGVYLHSDGYPTWTGKILLEHYTNAEKVKELINLGHLSSLGERVRPIGKHSFDNPERGTTVAYMRDRGETEQEAVSGSVLADVESCIGHSGHIYIFKDNKWYYTKSISYNEEKNVLFNLGEVVKSQINKNIHSAHIAP